MTIESSGHAHLFRVLLLEDIADLRDNIIELMQSEFPYTQFVPAGTIEEALQVIGAHADWSLAILDIRVPMNDQRREQANPQVASRLRELAVPCIFMTGYPDSDDVKSFLADRTIVDASIAVVEKKVKSGYLIGELKRHTHALFQKIACAKVKAAIQDAFGSSAAPERSSTASLIYSQNVVRMYWGYLDTATKALVRNWFVIRETEGSPPQLSMFEGDH